MTKVALLGAGGKMGARLASNLRGSKYSVDHVEVSERARQELRDTLGIDCVDQTEALKNADVVILAVPDQLIGTITHSIIDRLRPGTAVMALDAAAPYSGQMPKRDDVTYFVTHPCHPPLFRIESDPEAQQDFFGGSKSAQAIVCALMQGPESHYAMCEEIARTFFAPVSRAHRCTLENLAVLEPAMSETVAATLCVALKEAMDKAVSRGVPRDAAFDFMLGHLSIELAIIFGVFPGQFSDGAMKAISDAKSVVFKEGWLERIFDLESVRASTREICNPKPTARA